MPRFCEPTFTPAALLVAATLCIAPPMMWPSTSDDQWNVVAKLTRKTTYTFVDRNHSCVSGKIRQLDDRAVTIIRRSAPEITMERTSLLRITWGGWAGGVIFSGRSSWSDVIRIVGRSFQPQIAVVMKSGTEHRGKLLSASNVALTLENWRKKININKDEVSSVSYIRPAPLSESAAYADDELAWMKVFDPQLWPRLLHLQSPLSVVLYDASVLEDNSSIVCNPGADVTQPAP
jgi:hypothetical protein